MPELEVLCEYLGPRLVGEKIAKVSVSPKFGFLLRTPPADLARALEGRTIDRLWRRGKFLLFAARMLPLRKRSSLGSEDIDALHAAVLEVLTGAVEQIRAQPDYQPHKQDRSFMKVHLHGGEPCPRCGHRIAEIKARGEVFNYC